MKKVSIITVCFNSSKTIRRTLESVLQQSYSEIEYLIIDGASTDITVDIIKEYEPLFQGRMKWVSEKDDGIYDAMNKGIRMASGELIGIINSDDYYEKRAVENIVNELTEDRYQILYGAMRTWKNGEEESINISSHKFLQDRMINHPSCFVTKAVYEDYGSYDTRYRSVADYDFMLRMCQHKEIIFKPVYKLIANFTTGGMCSSGTAYEELVRMKYERGMISKRKYKYFLRKSTLYHMIKQMRMFSNRMTWRKLD